MQPLPTMLLLCLYALPTWAGEPGPHETTEVWAEEDLPELEGPPIFEPMPPGWDAFAQDGEAFFPVDEMEAAEAVSSGGRGREAQIEEAAKRYRDAGEAPVLKRSSTVIYPFDESHPVIRCSPLRACDIELQAGEAITGIAIGDSERWITSPLESGEVEAPVPHVIVKPVDYDLATNLIIATTARTYHLGLVSPAIDALEDGELGYHRHVSFYYPEEMVQRWATEEKLRQRQAKVKAQQRVALQPPPPIARPSAAHVEALNFEYELKHKRRIRWAPTTVFDDGAHFYIQMPETVRSMDLPALLIEAGDGQLAVPNYRVKGRWYIVDGVFEKAELVLGVGKHRRRVKIRNVQKRGA